MNEHKMHNNIENVTHHAKKSANKLEDYLHDLFEKAPHLPKELKDLLIIITPWLALVFGALGILASLGGGTISALLAIPTLGLSLPFLVSFLFAFASSVLAVMAFTGLRDNKKSGWDKLFLSQIVSILGTIVIIFFGGFSVGTILGALISFYLMFEIRSHYK